MTGILADEARLAEDSDPELVVGEREAYGGTRSVRLEQAYLILESLAELLHVNIRTLYMAWAIWDALELEQGRVFVIAGIDHYTGEVMETLLASTQTVVLEPPIDMEAVAESEQSIPVLSLEFRQQIKQIWLNDRSSTEG